MSRRRPSSLVLAVAAAVLVGWASATAGAAQPQALLLIQSKPTGAAGGEVDVVGLGFEAGVPVEVRWNGIDGPQLGGGVGLDLRASVAVPAAASPRLYSIVGVSRDANGVLSSAASTPYLVTAAGADPARAGPLTPPPKATRPAKPTSAAAWPALTLALAAAVAWGRHSQRQRPSPATPSPVEG